jgi:RNA polymerase sigma-70 factor (ECF subfamily)
MKADFDQLITHCRAPMLQLAMRLIQPKELAEDTVQQALLALVESPQSLEDATDPRLYVFGVLKFKITDALRQRYRQPVCSVVEDDQTLDELLFVPDGHWDASNAPQTWNSPEWHLQHNQFLALVDACVTHLPDKIAKVFSMRAFLEFEAEEICNTLQLNKADYWQCLSRARKQLQICLGQQGFHAKASP